MWEVGEFQKELKFVNWFLSPFSTKLFRIEYPYILFLLGNALLILEVGSNSELRSFPIRGPHQPFVFAAIDIA